ncbi:type II secretion system GspH family protein [Patescibacteria group bacterium]|nr:type II secretion system GspH family protein [Patescibacteria group bacterium]
MMKKGFTLIELLVVITIIGILASIVLVSFPGATDKARDSRIVSAISQARTVMTYINANDGDYDALQCTADCVCDNDELNNLCKEINDNNKLLTFGFVRSAASNSLAGCIWADLNATGNQNYYCADNTGLAGFTSTTPTGAGFCVNGTSAICPTVGS